jgi:dCMP deaminase
MPSNISMKKAGKYLRLAHFLGHEFSKDPRTKIGAIVLNGNDFSPHSFGYNGMPRGCNDFDEARMTAPEKYYWFAHAEANAIDNAAKLGIPLKDCWMVVTALPCMTCARSIVQTGMKGVITLKPNPEMQARWADDFARSRALLAECGLELLEFDALPDGTIPIPPTTNAIPLSLVK